MHEIIEELQELNERVALPLELATFEQLVEVEEQILLPIPPELKEHLLYSSNVIYGSLEPVTAADPGSHTYLAEVTAYAWSLGLSREFMPICAHGEGFYCISQEGEIQLWLNEESGFDEHYWESFWQWVEDVWINNK